MLSQALEKTHAASLEDLQEQHKAALEKARIAGESQASRAHDEELDRVKSSAETKRQSLQDELMKAQESLKVFICCCHVYCAS